MGTHAGNRIETVFLSSKVPGFLLLVTALSLTLFDCADTQLPLPDGSSVVLTEGTYFHRYSNMEFPERVGGFQRKRLVTYDPDEQHLSVRYDLVTSGRDVAATIFVYPCADTGDDSNNQDQHHFDALKVHIMKDHPEAVLVYEGEVKFRRAGEIRRGKMASFKFTDVFAYGVERLLSHVYLFRNDKWFIEYRITYPQVQHDAVVDEVNKFLSSFQKASGKEWLKYGVEE
jgi:hypothetical protein